MFVFLRKIHVFEGLAVHLEEQNGAVFVDFCNRFAISIFIAVFVGFSSVLVAFLETIWHRFCDGKFADI